MLEDRGRCLWNQVYHLRAWLLPNEDYGPGNVKLREQPSRIADFAPLAQAASSSR